MQKIGIVILNYLAYQTTIETVASFEKQEKNGFEIQYVIIDNGSPNESYEVLRKEYENRSDILVIKTEKNLGFANGNNFGCQELLKQMQPDFIVISNDDILLPQEGLYQWIADCYEKYQFSVLGPDVYSVNGKFHQSPCENFSQDKAACQKKLREIQIKYFKSVIKKFLHYSKYSGYPTWENEQYQQVHHDKTLHGSFQIFSNRYFRNYSEPYDPSTFLYMEEDILKLRCDKKHLSMVYDPSYQVHHLQAVATNASHTNQYDKQLFRYKHIIQSLKAYIRQL